MPKRLKLEGSDCVSCAYKIEDAPKKEGFEFALVDPTAGELVIDGDVEKVKEIVKKVNPDVKTIEKDGSHHDLEHGHDHEHGKKDSKKTLYFIILSLILFTIGITLSHYYNYDGKLVLGIFALSYILVGWRVLKNALVNIIHGKPFDENFLIAVATIGAFVI